MSPATHSLALEIARANRGDISEDGLIALRLMRFRGYQAKTARLCPCGQALDETDLEWCAQCGRDRGAR